MDHNNRSPDDQNSNGTGTEACDIGIDGSVVSSTKGLTPEGYTGRSSRFVNPRCRRYYIWGDQHESQKGRSTEAHTDGGRMWIPGR